MNFISRTCLTIAAVCVAVGCLATPQLVGAQGLGATLKGGLNNAAPKELTTGETDLSKIVGNIISTLIGLLGAVLFIYLLYGGFLYMTAAGNETQVKQALAIIKNAVIGMVIIALSYAIATFVINRLSEITSPGSQSEGTPSDTP